MRCQHSSLQLGDEAGLAIDDIDVDHRTGSRDGHTNRLEKSPSDHLPSKGIRREVGRRLQRTLEVPSPPPRLRGAISFLARRMKEPKWYAA